MTRVLLSSPSADRRIERAAAWLAERPEPHVTIVAASLDAASEVARRALVASGKPASFGWQRTTLSMLATSLARPELAMRGLVPAGTLALEAICARVVHGHPSLLGRLSPIADRPGLPRALARTFTELRLARVNAPEDADLARLLPAYERELAAAALADRALVFSLAEGALRSAATRGAVLLLDLRITSSAERDLVASVAEHASSVLAVLPAGDLRAEKLVQAAIGIAEIERLAPPGTSAVGRAQSRLFERDLRDEAHDVPGDELCILSAPGESRECVEIARAIAKEAARGTPLDAMAVLLRSSSYGPLLVEAFRRARIPAYFARGTRKPDPSGRAFLALLACVAEGLSASRFAEYLSLGEVPEPTRDGAPPPAAAPGDRFATPHEEELAALLATNDDALGLDDADDLPDPRTLDEDASAPLGTLRAPRHWERLLVDASVIGGKDRWQSRLDGLAAKLEEDVRAYEKKSDEGLAQAARRDLSALRVLTAFALPLVSDLDALPSQARWSDWLEQLKELTTRALRHPERVLAVLGELAPMGSVGPVGLTEVRLVLEPRLAALLVPTTGRRYGKVLVATIEEARGLAFDVVFIPGVAEKTFPQKVAEDPLLLDDVRRRTSGDLATNDDRAEDERLALRLAVGAARRRLVISYPRLDVEAARPRTPSFYALEVLRVAEGALHGFEYLQRKAADAADARIGWPAPRAWTDAIDEAEYDLARLRVVLDKPAKDVTGEARYLLDANDGNPHLARALRFRWARWDKAFRSSDGLVNPAPEALSAIQEHGIGARSFSPTALQHFAACPYRFLLSAVHRLAPREEPAAIEDMDPLTRGSLTHEVQFELLTKLRDEGLLPVKLAHLDRARTILDGVLHDVEARFRDRLRPAIVRVWDDAIEEIGADLREWLRRMTEEPDWTPSYFELSFGLKDRRDQDTLSTDEPITLETGLRLRGSIDLVERRDDGAVRATDYKTGKTKAVEGETVIGKGEILQPVLYALALEKLFAGTKVVGSRLYYCTSKAGFAAPELPLDDEARAAAALVTKAVEDAVERGSLPAAPAKDACRWCDYRSVCGPYEEARVKVKTASRDGKKRLDLLTRLRGHR